MPITDKTGAFENDNIDLARADLGKRMLDGPKMARSMRLQFRAYHFFAERTDRRSAACTNRASALSLRVPRGAAW